MRNRVRPLVLSLAAALALALAACGQDAGSPGTAAPPPAMTDCDEFGVQMSLTPAGEVGDRTYLALGLVNCGQAPLVLDSMPQVGVFGGNVVAPRDANVPESVTLAPGQGAFTTLSWTQATREGDTVEVDRILVNALPVVAGYELDLPEPVTLDYDHVLDLGSWQVAAPGAEPAPEETPSETEEPDEEACPPEGFRIGFSEDVNAAMGIRAVGITMLNCGEEPIEVNGYPVVEIPGVELEVREGSDTLQDPGATPITVEPGEEVSAGMSWRNLVEGGESVDATSVDIGYSPESPLQTATPPWTIDLGTTRDIEVTAWR
ncbi:DUF4232 domain-containing protein [Glycomyces paridis]|uniref:DUF4232 domain-containing protein n=1 Tax=Glycomyces paridis TaxID=2126555 RepID=A0A4S8PCD9_9ACTN|nr:DUF4232 domain-containing protein [Glycomyces paridis]THV25954.1 DUF4232 domain-containing protein [Glycomyces paridis]